MKLFKLFLLLLLFLVGLIMVSLGLYLLIVEKGNSELGIYLLFFGFIILLCFLTFALLHFETWRRKGARPRKRERLPLHPGQPPLPSPHGCARVKKRLVLRCSRLSACYANVWLARALRFVRSRLFLSS